MTKRKSPDIKPRSAAAGSVGHTDQRRGEAPSNDAISRHIPSPAAIREAIESVVIAFVLAFLFRTFEAEAFVIPTGSMAPTLMGRHKDLFCPKCGCNYQVSASEEVDSEGNWRTRDYQTTAGTCPMCRYTDQWRIDDPRHPSYSGDRLLVSKFQYELADPDRWDVIVFKFPGDETNDARTNFIKRLVGLPGETIRIQHGDIWVRKYSSRSARGIRPHAEREEHEGFEIARKPPEKLLAMLQPVFDNDYMPQIEKYGWPARWQPEPAVDGSTAGQWSADDAAAFHTDGAGKGETWLRYHHLVPSYQQWRAVLGDREPSPQHVAGQLITDFTAYDTGGMRNYVLDPEGLGLHWVGDLALRCTAEVKNDKGELLLELRKGGRRFQCRIDVATGQATLSISGRDMEKFRPTATTSVRGPGRHELRFSNCDNELRLWVDGSVVAFDSPTTYDDLGNSSPDQSDLTPVAMGAAGVQAEIRHLALFRDIYYGAVRGRGSPEENHDVRYAPGEALPDRPVEIPSIRYVDFSLGADQFFVLGDNSAKSKDGRLWGQDRYWVPRELLIGKALFLYWPHSWDKIPYVNIPFPFFPNFGKMGLVR